MIEPALVAVSIAQHKPEAAIFRNHRCDPADQLPIGDQDEVHPPKRDDLDRKLMPGAKCGADLIVNIGKSGTRGLLIRRGAVLEAIYAKRPAEDLDASGPNLIDAIGGPHNVDPRHPLIRAICGRMPGDDSDATSDG